MTKVSLVIKQVIFSVFNGELKVFLPNFVLPVGVLKKGESLDAAAERIFGASSGLPLRDSYLEQLYTFSHPNNRGGEIAVVYYLLVPEFCIPSHDREVWIDCSQRLDSVFLGHNCLHGVIDISDLEIIEYAIQRLRWKIEYTNVVYSLLPKEFTFRELQNTYEAILGRELDKRNFRKKILCLNILKSTGHKKLLGKARPAEMFSFRKRKLTMVEVL